MKILNIHGFMGESDNKNFSALCEIYGMDKIISPQTDYIAESPSEISEKFEKLVCGADEELYFVGQSLGCWFADRLSRKMSVPCVLTNPCYFPHELDIISGSDIPREFLEYYRENSPAEKNPLAVTVCSDHDTVIPGNYGNCERLSAEVISIYGDHSITDGLAGHLRNAFEIIGNLKK